MVMFGKLAEKLFKRVPAAERQRKLLERRAEKARKQAPRDQRKRERWINREVKLIVRNCIKAMDESISKTYDREKHICVAIRRRRSFQSAQWLRVVDRLREEGYTVKGYVPHLDDRYYFIEWGHIKHRPAMKQDTLSIGITKEHGEYDHGYTHYCYSISL